jgi:DNA-binding beta-propeller fold protein YncE
MNRREFLIAAAPLAFAPRACGLLATAARRADPVALVTADTEAHVVEVALSTGRIRRRIPTLDGPHGIQSGGGVAVVAHTDAGAVSLIEGGRVRRVLRGFSAPRYAAIAGRHAFVTDSGAGELATIDLDRSRVVRRTPVGAHARHVTLDPAGRTLWIGLGSSAAALVVVDVRDPARPRVIRHVAPPFAAHDVGFSPTGHRVWVTAAHATQVAIYAADGSRPQATLPAAVGPQHVTFGPHAAYVASGSGRSVRVHALSDGRVLHETRVPIGSYNVQRGAGRVLTPSLDMGALTALDGRGRVLWQIQAAAHAHDVCVL